MRVATYTQPNAAVRGSLPALLVLVLTIVLGSSALHTLMTHFAPALHSGIAVLWLLTYIAAFFGLMFNHGINWISWLARYRILLVILLLGTIVSVSWSLDAAVSAERVVHLVGCSILAIYLGFMIPLLTTLRITAVVLGIIMLASVAAALGMPDVGRQSYEGTIVWSGILNSKNALGFWAAVAVLLYLTLSASYQHLMMRFLCFVFAAISLYVLIESDSATSLLAMLVAGALSLYLYIAFRFQLGFIRMVVLAICFGGLLGFALSNIDTAEIFGRSGDLTGRGEVWRQTWKLIIAQPLTGYGYGSIWFPNDATLWIQQSLTDFTWVVYHAHNGFLQVASEIGLPLSCIALLMVAQQLIEIFYCQYERQQVGVLFVLAFVVAYLISNFSEARFLVNRELYWIFFIALPISMLRQISVVSLDEEQYEDDEYPERYDAGSAYAHAGVPPDKPWLRPIKQTAAARIGAPARNNSSVAPSAHASAQATSQAAQLTQFDETDLDLGDEPVGHVSTLPQSSNDDEFDVGGYNADDVGDETIVDAPRDQLPPIAPFEEYHNDDGLIIEPSDDRYNIDDARFDQADRYDMQIDERFENDQPFQKTQSIQNKSDDDDDDDDEHDETLDISLLDK